jgi:hypothetical protein
MYVGELDICLKTGVLLGNRENCENYRGINSLCTARKLYDKITLRNMRVVSEPLLNEDQKRIYIPFAETRHLA